MPHLSCCVSLKWQRTKHEFRLIHTYPVCFVYFVLSCGSMDDSTKSLQLAVTLHPVVVAKSARVENNSPSIPERPQMKWLQPAWCLICVTSHQWTSHCHSLVLVIQGVRVFDFKPSEIILGGNPWFHPTHAQAKGGRGTCFHILKSPKQSLVSCERPKFSSTEKEWFPCTILATSSLDLGKGRCSPKMVGQDRCIPSLGSIHNETSRFA